jgi:3-deoxy-D-manno-octulosonate 8-phosphate phosphatase (KDO 8-P phosphatase)
MPSFAPPQTIRLLIMDVDGVLTDAGVNYVDDGLEFKRFCSRDGSAIKRLQRSGVSVALLSGRKSPAVERRGSELGIELLFQGVNDKLPVFEQILQTADVSAHEVAYVGDDLLDLACMAAAEWSAAPADAHPAVRAHASYVTQAEGGYGAAAEVCDVLMQAQGTWATVVREYVAAGSQWRARQKEDG